MERYTTEYRNFAKIYDQISIETTEFDQKLDTKHHNDDEKEKSLLEISRSILSRILKSTSHDEAIEMITALDLDFPSS